jgi:hypothetical protein
MRRTERACVVLVALLSAVVVSAVAEARVYLPEIGRWTRRDLATPIALAATCSYSALSREHRHDAPWLATSDAIGVLSSCARGYCASADECRPMVPMPLGLFMRTDLEDKKCEAHCRANPNDFGQSHPWRSPSPGSVVPIGSACICTENILRWQSSKGAHADAQALQILVTCVAVHEGQHLSMCPTYGSYCANEIACEECIAYRKGLACLSAALHGCATEMCRAAIQRRIEAESGLAESFCETCHSFHPDCWPERWVPCFGPPKE